jgi:hypothetical protein
MSGGRLDLTSAALRDTAGVRTVDSASMVERATGSPAVLPVILAVLILAACESSATTKAAASSLGQTTTTATALPEPRDYGEACRLIQGNCSDVSGQMPETMLRSITLPRVRAGALCPISPIVPTPTGANFGPWTFDSGTTVGLAAAPSPTERVSVAYKGPTQTHWIFPWTVKALWFATAAYDGPILIRGEQLDGPGPIAFATGSPGAGWLLIPPGPTLNTTNGIRTVPSAILVTHAGCYGFQIDTPTFTGSVVIQITLAS